MPDQMKTCSICGLLKNFSEFARDAYKSDGHTSACKKCRNTRRNTKRAEDPVFYSHKLAKEKEYLDRNRDKINAYNAKRRKDNPEKYREAVRRYRENHPDRIKEHRAKYKEKNREYGRRWRKRQRQIDPLWRVKQLLRASIHRKIQKLLGGTSKGAKSNRTEQLLGCPFEELFQRIGFPTTGYHLDHICPLAQARTVREVERLFHYSNLQWLPATINIIKKDKRTPEGEEKCRELLEREWIDA